MYIVIYCRNFLYFITFPFSVLIVVSVILKYDPIFDTQCCLALMLDCAHFKQSSLALDRVVTEKNLVNVLCTSTFLQCTLSTKTSTLDISRIQICTA